MRQAQDLHRLSARALGPPTRTQREVKGDRLSAHPPGPLPELLQDFAAAPAARRATSEQRRGRQRSPSPRFPLIENACITWYNKMMHYRYFTNRSKRFMI